MIFITVIKHSGKMIINFNIYHMINYLKIIIISIIFIQSSGTISKQSLNISPADSIGGKNKENIPGITLSLGAGSSVYETSFILSPDITWDLTENASVSTGTDIYFGRNRSATKVSINLISYYKFKPSEKTIIQVGFGGAYFNKSILPLFSVRLDQKMFGNSYIGIGIKSLISFGGDKFPFPLIMLNYSIKF